MILLVLVADDRFQLNQPEKLLLVLIRQSFAAWIASPCRDPYCIDPLAPWTDTNAKRSSRGTAVLPLDGVRGLAVLIVIAAHTLDVMRGQGSLGVFLFFTLSGFVLMLPYAEKTERIRSELAAYLWNRLLRIVPAYVVALYFIWGRLHHDTETPLYWLLPNLTFVQTWNHLWSVAEEVQFYFLFPIVVALMGSVTDKWRSPLLLLIGIVVWICKDLHQVQSMDGPNSFYFYFFVGGMLAARITILDGLPSWLRIPMWVLPAILLAALILGSNFFLQLIWPTSSLNGWAIPELWCFLFVGLLISVIREPRSPIAMLISSWT